MVDDRPPTIEGIVAPTEERYADVACGHLRETMADIDLSMDEIIAADVRNGAPGNLDRRVGWW